ncbi:MAG: C69 family dipeptidase [Elusimicrobiota bacterium]|jgi:dipeptidase|nr:C69 family dipeptidase [Elusimicrobiota bacterium]
MKDCRLAVWSFLIIGLAFDFAFAGTTIIVTKGASVDGSMIVAHSYNGELSDASIAFVPAKDWGAGSMRTIYASAASSNDITEFNAFLIPRMSDKNRAAAYDHIGVKRTKPIGYIPQVSHTYAYLDANYGIINEHGLMFGECSNNSLFISAPAYEKRIFYGAELSRIALERAKTAREAIQIIGELVDKYGYYGSGETLPIADGEEAWVMEIAPSPEGRGALWVAQKLPDGHFFVAAEQFRIRDIIENNPDQIYSAKLFAIVEKFKIRKPQDNSQPMDWLLTVSAGEYNHPYYSLRRVWRAFNLFAPSLKLSPWVKDAFTKDYLFSVKPDKKIALETLMALYRDHYEGTEFDLTQGIAAGAFGNPNRYFSPQDMQRNANPNGAWETPISNSNTVYAYISQNKPNMPFGLNAITWVALDTTAESVFVPLAVSDLPTAYYKGNPSAYEADSAYWVYNMVAEFANVRYNYIAKDIQERAYIHEKNSEKAISEVSRQLSVLAKTDPQKAALEFFKVLNKNAMTIMSEWRNFFFDLLVKYNQGYINTIREMSQKEGYSQEWLNKTNYKNGPISYDKK